MNDNTKFNPDKTVIIDQLQAKVNASPFLLVID